MFRLRGTRRPPPRPPRSTTLERSLPRSVVDARAGPPAVDQVNASADVEPDQPDDACSIPSQLLTVEMLRRPLESTLHAAVAVMNELVEIRSCMERLLESIQRKIASKRARHTPAHDPSREDVGDEGHVDEARPRGDVGEIRHPKLIRTIGGEVPLNEIRRSKGRMIGDRGLERSAAYDALEAHLTHQPLYRTSGDFDPFSAKLTPDFARTVDAEVLLPDPLDLLAELDVANRPSRKPRGVRLAGLLLVVGRRGDRKLSADRLDPVLLAMLVDERHHHLGRRSSSAWAKYADALRRISLARRSSRTSRSSSLIRAFSSLVTPPRRPESTSVCRTHFRSVSGEHPIFSAIEQIASHRDPYSSRCSKTIRTDRSRTSWENLLARAMTPSSQGMEPPGNPGRFSRMRVAFLQTI